MARRRTRGSGAALGFVVIVGGAIWLIQSSAKFVQEAWPLFAFLALAAIVSWIASRVISSSNRKREGEEEARRQRELYDQKRAELFKKYDDATIVDEIMLGGIWHDMSKEQLLDSWGPPIEVETKKLKTKTRETYKYDQIGRGRFARRAYLENDRVFGWEQK